MPGGGGGVINVNFHWATEETHAGGGMINVNFRWATGGSGHGGDPCWGGHDQCQLPLGHTRLRPQEAQATEETHAGWGGVINVNFHWATEETHAGGGHDQCQLPLGHRRLGPWRRPMLGGGA